MMRFLFIFLLSVPFVSANAQVKSDADYLREYQERISKEYINKIYIPADLADSHQQLDEVMERDAKIKFMTLTEIEATKKYHFILGRWVIKNWSLDEGSRLSKYMRDKGVFRSDDMAKYILLTYHRYLHGNPLGEEELLIQLAEKYAKEKAKRAAGQELLHSETRKRKQN
ncbi:MAG: GTP cyclohydrolase [Bacteroidia bacterium]|nr:GTP cyclohydrolase [Bacteroidia bacterium]